MAHINIPPNALLGLNRAAAALYRPEATISNIKRRLGDAFISTNPNITPQQKQQLKLQLDIFASPFPMNVNKEIRIPRVLMNVETIIRNTNNRPAFLGNGGRRSRRRRTRRSRSRRTRHRK